MSFSKPIGAGAVFLTALSVAHSQPATPSPIAPTPHAATAVALALQLNLLLPFVNDPAFQAELKLRADQVKRLLALRQKVWDDEYNTPPAEQLAKRAERDAALVTALKEILTDEQFRRAEQLALQFIWKPGVTLSSPFAGSGPGADPARVAPNVLKQHPELARALALTDDQRKFADLPIGTQLRATILLTPEQVEAARKLLGPVHPTAWKAERDPRMTAVQLFAYTDTFSPLRIAATYRAELKITDDQFATIGKPPARFGSRYLNDISPAEALKKAKEADDESEKVLTKALMPEQMIRIRQIAMRWQFDPALRNTSDPLVVALADELKATAQQRRTFDALRKAHAEAVGRAAALDDFDAAYTSVRAANAEFEKGLLDVLTDDQRAKLKAQAGEALATTRPGRYSRPLTEAARKQREEAFGRYNDELALLNTNKSVQTELKLSPDQLDLTKKSSLEVTKRFGTGTKAKMVDQAERSKFIGEALAAILDPQQAKRFRQLMIQRRERPDSPLSTAFYSGLTYPGVTEELKLSAEQKKRVIDGEHPLDFLTDAQRKAFREMLGERFTGDFSRSTFTTTPPRPDPLQTERDRAEFLKVAPLEALNLKPEQQTKLAVALNRYQLDMPEGRPKAATKDDSAKVVRAFQTELTRAIGPENVTRFDQLVIQSRAAHNLRDALAHPDVSKALQLTPLQLVRIADIEDDAADLGTLVTASPLSPQARDDALRRLRDRFDARIFALLTPEQGAKWKELTGEPYAGFAKTVIRGPILRTRSSIP